MNSNKQPDVTAEEAGGGLAGERGSSEFAPLLIKRPAHAPRALDEEEFFINDESMFDEMRLDTHRHYEIGKAAKVT